MQKLIISLFLLLFSLNINSQNIDVYGAKFSYGYIMPHRPDIRYLINRHIPQYNLNVGYQTKGKKDWQNHWGFPEIGFGLYYANLGNPDVLGTSKAAYLYFDAPIFSEKFFAFNFFLGLGSAYLSKPFNYQTNPTNIAIGTHFNIYANVNFETQLRMPKFVYFVDLGINHYSNGGSKKPNLGLNIPAVSLGVKYKKSNFSKTKGMGRYFNPFYDLQILQSVTVRAPEFSVSQKPLLLTTISVDLGKYVSNRSRFGVGLEFMYDANAVYNFEYANNYSTTSNDYFSAGVHLSYAAVIGNVQFTFQELYFFYRKYNFYKQWQRYGFRVFLGQRIALGATLSTYFFQALFIEPSIGIRYKF